MDSRFSLRWNNYASQITDAFGSLLLEEDLVDVTLSCEGKKIKAHKMLLSACSPYFRDIFKENPCQHPVIVFRNVQFVDLKAIVDFIYCGEVNVLQEQLESFLNTAGLLEVKGLTDKENESGTEETSGITVTDEENMQTDLVRKQRLNSTKKQVSRRSTNSGLSSPPAKKRKENVEKPPDKVTVPTEVATVVKEEVDEINVVDELEDSEPFTPEVLTLGPMISLQGSVAETSKDIGVTDPASCLSLKIYEDVKITESKGHRIRETENSKYRLSKFRRSWMLESRFSSWLEECEYNPYSAFCRVCQKMVSLSNMGTRALTSHMNGKKHQDAVSVMEEMMFLNGD